MIGDNTERSSIEPSEDWSKMAYRPSPERILQKEVMRYLSSLGVFCWENKTQGTYDPSKRVYRTFTGLRGVSDVLGIVPDDGRILAIELKSKTGRVRPEQKAFLERIQKDGGVAGVCRSLKEVEVLLSFLFVRGDVE